MDGAPQLESAESNVVEDFVPVLTAAVGLIGGIVLTSVTFRKQLEEKFATELHARRMQTYPKLWELLEPLSIYPETSISSEEAADLSETLKCWYYRDGGFYLSTESRERYTALQKTLTGAVTTGKEPTSRAAASSLRTAMAADCSTRKRTKL